MRPGDKIAQSRYLVVQQTSFKHRLRSFFATLCLML